MVALASGEISIYDEILKTENQSGAASFDTRRQSGTDIGRICLELYLL